MRQNQCVTSVSVCVLVLCVKRTLISLIIICVVALNKKLCVLKGDYSAGSVWYCGDHKHKCSRISYKVTP